MLYLLRHGDYAAAPGADDGPLTPDGRAQVDHVAGRLAGTPFTAVHHSPAIRATETARIVAAALPGVPVRPDDLLADAIPSIPDLPSHAEFFAGLTDAERAEGPPRAAAALGRFGQPADVDCRELLVTHNFLIGWFVRDALDAPDWRWVGLNQYQCGLSVILYRTGRPAALVSYNDVGHLPPELRGAEHLPGARV